MALQHHAKTVANRCVASARKACGRARPLMLTSSPAGSAAMFRGARARALAARRPRVPARIRERAAVDDPAFMTTKTAPSSPQMCRSPPSQYRRHQLRCRQSDHGHQDHSAPHYSPPESKTAALDSRRSPKSARICLMQPPRAPPLPRCLPCGPREPPWSAPR
jgi:hypothetical protein